jgi:hypothetical protein
MERFKNISGEPKRLASTSGHVVIVGEEFADVPDHLVRDAFAKGLMSETVFNQAKDEAKKSILTETQTETEKQEALQKKNQAILGALSQITEMVNAGQSATPAGNKLIHNGTPVLSAVSELAGFDVKRADIELALA